jgi:hypothetical protein
MTVRRPVPVTERERKVVEGWIAAVRRGETSVCDPELDRFVADVLEEVLAGAETLDEISKRFRSWARTRQSSATRDPTTRLQ